MLRNKETKMDSLLRMYTQPGEHTIAQLGQRLMLVTTSSQLQVDKQAGQAALIADIHQVIFLQPTDLHQDLIVGLSDPKIILRSAIPLQDSMTMDLDIHSGGIFLTTVIHQDLKMVLIDYKSIPPPMFPRHGPRTAIIDPKRILPTMPLHHSFKATHPCIKDMPNTSPCTTADLSHRQKVTQIFPDEINNSQEQWARVLVK